MPTAKFTPTMSVETDAMRIFTASGWNASFELVGQSVALRCAKAGCTTILRPIPDETYITNRLPVSFFLAVFEQAAIREYGGFVPMHRELINWGFCEAGRHYEKNHATNSDCKVELRLYAGPAEPYLLLVTSAAKKHLLTGQPQSIFHFLHPLEQNGFFEPDWTIEETANN